MEHQIDIGIPAHDRQMIAEGLSHLLADTYVLYIKTHGFHWNVTGPMFSTLHTMFEAQYTELSTAVDEIAERIRSLGFEAPGSGAAFAKLKSIDEADGAPRAEEMVAQLAADQAAVARVGRNILPLAEAGKDEVTADLVTQRLQVHEKTAWMLRALLENSTQKIA